MKRAGRWEKEGGVGESNKAAGLHYCLFVNGGTEREWKKEMGSVVWVISTSGELFSRVYSRLQRPSQCKPSSKHVSETLPQFCIHIKPCCGVSRMESFARAVRGTSAHRCMSEFCYFSVCKQLLCPLNVVKAALISDGTFFFCMYVRTH